MILTKIMTERFLTDFWASKMRNDENVVPLFVDKIFEQILVIGRTLVLRLPEQDRILTTDYADLHG